MKVAVLVIPLVLVACGSNSQTASLSTDTEASWQPMAEYEPVSGVLLGTGWQRWAENYSGGDLSEQQRSAKVKRANEYYALYLAMATRFPEIRYYIHTSKERTQPSSNYSEYEAWQPLLPKLRATGASIDLFALDPAAYPPGTDENRLSEDEWTRDYGAFTQKKGSERRLFTEKGRGELVNEYVADAESLSLHREKEESRYEGGNFMTTSTGVCAMAGRSSDFHPSNRKLMLEKLGCRKALTLPALPNEETGHIDLYAKFLADDRVAVARYTSSAVNVNRDVTVLEYSCTAEQISAKNWLECTLKRRTTAPNRLGSDGSAGRLRFDAAAGVISLEAEYFAGAVFQKPYSQPDLADFSRSITDTFVAAGFKVVEVPAPTPELMYVLVEYRGPDGTVVYREGARNYVHRSFTNSLLVNGTAFIPTYDDDSAAQLQKAAFNAYRDASYEPIGIDMTETIRAGGAVHCLTMEMHR